MKEFFRRLTNGLAVGGIYALIALGYTMVYGVLRLINFAHRDLFTLDSHLGLTLLFSLGLQGKMSGILVGRALIVMSVGLVAIVGYLLEWVAYRPLRGSNRLAAVVLALGAPTFSSNAIMLAYGAWSQVYPNGILPSVAVNLLGVDIPLVRIVMFVGTVVLTLLLYWFINHTRIGTAIRAIVIDQSTAKFMGINIDNIVSMISLIGPAFGGAVGVTMGLYYGQITYDMGLSFGLKALTATIIGGIGNIPGAMVGGILLGVLEVTDAAYVSIAWKDAIAFPVPILILTFCPAGLLGERVTEKI